MRWTKLLALGLMAFSATSALAQSNLLIDSNGMIIGRVMQPYEVPYDGRALVEMEKLGSSGQGGVKWNLVCDRLSCDGLYYLYYSEADCQGEMGIELDPYAFETALWTRAAIGPDGTMWVAKRDTGKLPRRMTPKSSWNRIEGECQNSDHFEEGDYAYVFNAGNIKTFAPAFRIATSGDKKLKPNPLR